MTEQERKKAFENQRRNAERRAKEADGTYDMERRIQYEKKQREEFYEKMRENDLILLLGEHHPKYKEALRQFQKNMRMKQTKEKGQNNEVHGQ